jgi:hypothetical protein
VTVATGQTEDQATFITADPEGWRDKHGIAEHFACGVRWIEARMVEGMPHTYIAGRAKFRVSEVEPWLERHGFIKRGRRDSA